MQMAADKILLTAFNNRTTTHRHTGKTTKPKVVDRSKMALMPEKRVNEYSHLKTAMNR